MNIERLFLLNPYNDSHLKKLIIFEEENKIVDKPSLYFKKIRETINEQDYFDPNKNDFEEIIFTEKSERITDCCYIKGERDLKQCSIEPFNIINKNKRRNLIEDATNYATNTLGMERVYIKADFSDNYLINYLELKGYENLGEVDGSIVLLKEKEEKENSQRMIS